MLVPKKNRKYLPKKVTHKRLKKREVKAQQNINGVIILPWKNKRDVFIISTEHDASGENALIIKL